MVTLFPQGPLDGGIWSRAGGDVASLRTGSTARAAWYSTILLLALAGGAANISMHSLLKETSIGLGANPDLKRFLGTPKLECRGYCLASQRPR